MKYFTHKLYLQLNSSDSETVDQAMEQWEKAIAAYRKSLQKLCREATQLRDLADLSLHDWNLLKVVPSLDDARFGDPIASASIVVKQDKNIVILWYSLSQKLQLVGSPKEWPFSKKQVHWLYDELDVDGNDQESLVHRILFSDGTTLVVRFSGCRVVQLKSDHAMSHSDLMQIA